MKEIINNIKYMDLDEEQVSKHALEKRTHIIDEHKTKKNQNRRMRKKILIATNTRQMKTHKL